MIWNSIKNLSEIKRILRNFRLCFPKNSSNRLAHSIRQNLVKSVGAIWSPKSRQIAWRILVVQNPSNRLPRCSPKTRQIAWRILVAKIPSNRLPRCSPKTRQITLRAFCFQRQRRGRENRLNNDHLARSSRRSHERHIRTFGPGFKKGGCQYLPGMVRYFQK